MKTWNHYICDQCGGTTVAKHEGEGVTPFIIRCRAKDIVGAHGHRGYGCDGKAASVLFNCSQDDAQTPHVIFHRPDAMEAIECINREPEKYRAGLLEHYQKGGSLLKECDPSVHSVLSVPS